LDWNIPGRPEIWENFWPVLAGTYPTPRSEIAHMESYFMPGYRFAGWSPQLGPVTENTTFTAQWEPIS